MRDVEFKNVYSCCFFSLKGVNASVFLYWNGGDFNGAMLLPNVWENKQKLDQYIVYH